MMNGWVMEGFPISKSQVNLLAALRIKPKIVILLEQTPLKAAEYYTKKKVDPENGNIYNLAYDLIKESRIKERLVRCDQDNDTYIT